MPANVKIIAKSDLLAREVCVSSAKDARECAAVITGAISVSGGANVQHEVKGFIKSIFEQQCASRSVFVPSAGTWPDIDVFLLWAWPVDYQAHSAALRQITESHAERFQPIERSVMSRLAILDPAQLRSASEFYSYVTRQVGEASAERSISIRFGLSGRE